MFSEPFAVVSNSGQHVGLHTHRVVAGVPGNLIRSRIEVRTVVVADSSRGAPGMYIRGEASEVGADGGNDDRWILNGAGDRCIGRQGNIGRQHALNRRGI